MRQTIDGLMAALSVARFPERWRGFYDEVMDRFDADGCALTDPAYYERLHAEYGVFPEYLDVFKEAAAAVGRNEALSHFLSLLAYALRDREAIGEDLSHFEAPQPPAGGHDLAYDMLPGLATASGIPEAIARMRERGLPEDKIIGTVRSIEKTVKSYRERFGGASGFHLLSWHQLTLDGKLFFVGRLQIEVPAEFRVSAAVFRHRDGRTVALADGIDLHRSGYALGARHFEDAEGAWTPTVTETGETYVGHPYDERGYVEHREVSLKKSEWTPVLRRGDKAVGIHIPGGGKLDDALVSETMAEIREFLATYFKGCDYRAFVCESWMMDPQLDGMLGPDANITKFRRRFHSLALRSAANGVFNFIFHRLDTDFRIEELPGDTSFQRKLKELYLGGGAIYEMYGYFF